MSLIGLCRGLGS